MPELRGHYASYMNAKAGTAWGAAAPDFDDGKLGVRVHFLSFFPDTKPLSVSGIFFLIHDKTMRWIALLTLAAFFMPRCSTITA